MSEIEKEIVTFLKKVLNEPGEDNFVIFTVDEAKDYYVQFARSLTQPPILHGEVVSNNNLNPEFALSESKITLLSSKGWSLQDNFCREWNVANEGDLLVIAEEVVCILTDIFGWSPREDLRVTLNVGGTSSYTTISSIRGSDVNNKVNQQIEDICLGFTKEELEIFLMLVKKFAPPPLELNILKTANAPPELLAKQRQFESNPAFSYLKDFIIKHPDGYLEEELLDLSNLLVSKGFYFERNELKAIINIEIKKQSYLGFRDTINATRPKSLDEYLKVFTSTYGPQIKSFVDYRKAWFIFEKNYLSREERLRIIEEEKIDFNLFQQLLHSYAEDLFNFFKYSKDCSLKISFLKKILAENKIELKYADGKEIDNEDLISLIIASTVKLQTKGKVDIYSISSEQFESLIVHLLQKMEFVVEHTGKTGDGGIDIKAELPIPIRGGKFIIQCKRYNKDTKVDVKDIRELFGVIHAEMANKGILITTSDFTSKAIDFAKGKPIELIDGDKLNSLLNQYLPDSVGSINTSVG